MDEKDEKDEKVTPAHNMTEPGWSNNPPGDPAEPPEEAPDTEPKPGWSNVTPGAPDTTPPPGVQAPVPPEHRSESHPNHKKGGRK